MRERFFRQTLNVEQALPLMERTDPFRKETDQRIRD